MKRFIIPILLLATLLTACVKEDYFGLSSYGNIKKFLVSNQAGNSIINNDSMTVVVEIPGGIDLSTISIQTLEISSFAISNKTVGDQLDLNEPAYISITAEDGSVHVWTVNSFVASANPQLDNWQLNEWYLTAKDYYEPGASAETTIWGTGNPGTQILNKTATIPLDLGNENFAAKMETLYNGLIPAGLGMPISAGSLFTGYFNPDNLDPTDPQAAIDFGTPFTGRPSKLRFKYQYQPGEENKDRNGGELNYPDMLDIYALLEVRLNGVTERLATAWFRSSETVEDLTVMEITFTYGQLDDTFPDYMKPLDNSYVSADSAAFALPTSITFVASSSFDGANFAGAVGSVLVVDDIEMVYDE
ncbi:MAG TPA: PCMD domain-containing protein [Bacteroidales bacterium]